MVARSAGCEQQALSTASLAASSNRDPHYVRLITDNATDFASKIRFSQKPSYSKLYSLTVPIFFENYHWQKLFVAESDSPTFCVLFLEKAHTHYTLNERIPHEPSRTLK